MVLSKNNTIGISKSKHSNIYGGKFGWLKTYISSSTKKFFKSTKDLIENILFIPEDNQIIELQNKVNKLEKELENIKKIKSTNNNDLNEKGKFLLRSFENIKAKYQIDNEIQLNILNKNEYIPHPIIVDSVKDDKEIMKTRPNPPPLPSTTVLNKTKVKPPPPALPPPSKKDTSSINNTINNNTDETNTIISSIPTRPKLLFNANDLQIAKKLKSINNSTNEVNNNQKRLFTSNDLQAVRFKSLKRVSLDTIPKTVTNSTRPALLFNSLDLMKIKLKTTNQTDPSECNNTVPVTQLSSLREVNVTGRVN